VIPLRTYVTLLRAFLDERLTAPEFETLFLQLFKHDPGRRPPQEFDALQTLFGEADAYCADPELRLETLDGIGDSELRAAAHTALEALPSGEAG